MARWQGELANVAGESEGEVACEFSRCDGEDNHEYIGVARGGWMGKTEDRNREREIG
jgi:hypothetical protein